MQIENNPNAPIVTNRQVSFSNELYIQRGDFEVVPPPKYHRLKPDGYVDSRVATLSSATATKRTKTAKSLWLSAHTYKTARVVKTKVASKSRALSNG